MDSNIIKSAQLVEKYYKQLLRVGMGDVQASKDFNAAYKTWMILRARNKDTFAVSLGYK